VKVTYRSGDKMVLSHYRCENAYSVMKQSVQLVQSFDSFEKY